MNYRNKPAIEIMANVYFYMIKYLEIELILTNELFGNDNSQFAKIITDSLSLVILYFYSYYSLFLK